MLQLCDARSCNGCTACANICPKKCINMTPDKEGFLRPVVEESACIGCGLCQKVCPVLHPPVLPQQEPELLATVNRDDADRLGSSSGGIFILLARYVLGKKGVVFGAAFQPDFSVAHDYAETESEVYRFCGSKYLQSKIGDSYQKVKLFLEQDRYVLFTGTPCQIIGLKQYLGKDYPKLITVDIICHGVPSPAVWMEYVRQRIASDHAGLPERIEFRAKDTGWTVFSMKFTYKDKRYCASLRDDPFMRGFLRDLYLRPSCYRCIAKGTRRVSDITLADFWNVQKLCPELFDDKGTSLVMVHSQKGKAAWEQIAHQVRCAPAPEEAIACNPAAVRSVTAHPNREEFFRRLEDCKDLSALILELTPDPVVKPPSLYRRIRGKMGRILRRWIGPKKR